MLLQVLQYIACQWLPEALQLHHMLVLCREYSALHTKLKGPGKAEAKERTGEESLESSARGAAGFYDRSSSLAAMGRSGRM